MRLVIPKYLSSIYTQRSVQECKVLPLTAASNVEKHLLDLVKVRLQMFEFIFLGSFSAVEGHC